MYLLSRVIVFVCFFFFKQKTAYEMRISDWSSDVCSSDLSFISPSQIPPPATQKRPEQADDHSARSHTDPRHSAGPDSGTKNGSDGAMGMVRNGGGGRCLSNVRSPPVAASALSGHCGPAPHQHAPRPPGAPGAGAGT